MRIAVDLRTLLEPFESGVTIYTKNMVKALYKLKGVQLDIFYQSAEPSSRIKSEFPEARHLKFSNTKFHLKSLFRFPVLPESYFPTNPDVIWIPDRRPFYRTDIPIVMTVHDFVPEKFTYTLSIKSRIWHKIFSLKRLLRLSSGVLTPSSTTASNLPRHIPFEVTYEGAVLSKKLSRPSGMRGSKFKPYFLIISPRDPRKGLNKVIKMVADFPKLNFVIAGLKDKDDRFSKTTLKKHKNLKLLGQITEEEKTWLLRNAQALLALSLYEGFDLPVLEAVQAKCPVILSDISVHRELYKSPECIVKSDTELRAAIHRFSKNKMKTLVPRTKYSWEKAAQRALLLFRRVVVHEDR